MTAGAPGDLTWLVERLAATAGTWAIVSPDAAEAGDGAGRLAVLRSAAERAVAAVFAAEPVQDGGAGDRGLTLRHVLRLAGDDDRPLVELEFPAPRHGRHTAPALWRTLRHLGRDCPAVRTEALRPAAGRGWPRTLLDGFGYPVTLAAPPQRVASLTLATDEILLELLPAGRLVALTCLATDERFSLVAPAARDAGVPAVLTGHAEQVLALRPDLAVVGNYTPPETRQALKAAGIPVLMQDRPRAPERVLDNVLLLGHALGVEQRAEELVDTCRRRLDALDRRVAGLSEPQRPRVLHYMPGQETSGLGSLGASVIRRVGGRPIGEELGLRGTKPLGPERAAATAPDVILSSGRDEDRESWLAWLRAHPALRATPAVRAGRLPWVPVPAFNTASHHVVQGLEQVYEAVHA